MSDLRMTVIGKSPAWADVGGASSGYLVQSAERNMLLDCGSGVIGELRKVCDPLHLDAVLITHLHADHFFDLVPLAYMLKYMPRAQQRPKPRLWLPAGGEQAIDAIAALWHQGEISMFADAFDIAEYGQRDELTEGDLRLRLAPVPHFMPTVAVDVRCGEARFTYGADCGPNDELPALAADTPLLICEATMPEPADGHLTARQAGQMAARAGAAQLLVTHFSDAYDPTWVAEQAALDYDGPVSLAEGGMSFAFGEDGEVIRR